MDNQDDKKNAQQGNSVPTNPKDKVVEIEFVFNQAKSPKKAKKITPDTKEAAPENENPVNKPIVFRFTDPS